MSGQGNHNSQGGNQNGANRQRNPEWQSGMIQINSAEENGRPATVGLKQAFQHTHLALRTLADIINRVGPDHGERLYWMVVAPQPNPTDPTPRARSLYNRPAKESVGYEKSVLAEHAIHVVKNVTHQVGRATAPRTLQRFREPISIQGRKLPAEAVLADEAMVGARTEEPVASVRAMTACGLVRLMDLQPTRQPRKWAILIFSGGTNKDSYDKFNAGFKGQEQDIMHMTTVANDMFHILPLKTEIGILRNHHIWADDYLQPLPDGKSVQADFIIAAPMKLRKEDSIKVGNPDGTFRMDYTSSVTMLKMKCKMQSVVNLAANENMTDIVLGAFGCGSCNHPVDEVARLWTEIIAGDAAKWRYLGMKFHFALPLGAGCSDDVWKAFYTNMADSPEIVIDQDSSQSWFMCKHACST